jgi:hypothetical protein
MHQLYRRLIAIDKNAAGRVEDPNGIDRPFEELLKWPWIDRSGGLDWASPFGPFTHRIRWVTHANMKLNRPWPLAPGAADGILQVQPAEAGTATSQTVVFSRQTLPRQVCGLKLDPTNLLEARTPDGALLSVRIPVTRSNRPLLQALRAAEVAAWNSRR